MRQRPHHRPDRQTTDLRPESDARESFSKSCIALLIFVLTVIALHKVALPSPIMAGDEYAHLAAVLDAIDNGRRIDVDPMLQGVYLPMFTWFGVLAAKFTTALVPAYKALNVIFFLLASVLMLAIARPIVAPRHLPVLALLLCISPISAYTAYLMPESLYYVLFAGLAAALVLVFPRNEKLGLAIAGLSTAALALTKPHAIALFAAVLASLALFKLLYAGNWRAGIAHAVVSCMLYTVATMIAMAGLNWATSGTLILNPYHLIGEFYRPFLQSGLNAGNIAARMSAMLRNGAGHLLVVAAIAGVPITCAILGWRRAAGGTGNWRTSRPAEREFLLVAFASFALLAMVLMTTSFTAQVARPENGQMFRLHGRYYSFALPLFFIILAMAHRVEATTLGRGRRALLLVAFAGGALILHKQFTIFPWDFPELVFLTGLDGTWLQTIQKVASLGVLLFVLAPKNLSIRSAFFSLWTATFLASLLIMLVWQKNQTSQFAKEIEAGKAAHLLLALNEQPQEIAVTGNDRYGRMSYFLFNLAARPRVIVADQPGSDLSGAVSGAGWIFSLFPQNLAVNGVAATGSLGPVRYYRLNHAAPYALEKIGMWNGEPLHLQLAAGHDDGLVTGGNAAEPWGIWTATETSVIHLPAMVHGKIRLTLDGWVPPEKVADALHVSLGDATTTLHLRDRREASSVELVVATPSRELVLSGITPWQPNAWDRPLAVAVVQIDIERLAP